MSKAHGLQKRIGKWTYYVILAVCLQFSFAAVLQSAAATDQEYTLREGDQIKITVYGHEDLTGLFRVDGAGNILFPLINNVHVLGLSRQGLIREIERRLKPDYLLEPKVSAEVIEFRPFYILGEVKNPGSYPFVNGLTLTNAVALAGGYTYRAKTNAVTISRAGDRQKKSEPAEKNTNVFPGDVIEVPERVF